MSDTLLPADFERAITLGLSRASSKAPDAQALATLALLAQRKRHSRQTAPNIDNTPSRLHDDPRPIMPEAARRPLLRLASSLPKDGWTHLGGAIFDRLEKKGTRLHPFDLPRLEGLLQANSGRLGQAERGWLALRRPAADEPPPDNASTNEADWLLLPKAQRAAVIRHLRTKDAAMAREWIERNIATAPADVRAILVEALEPALSAADTPLLERLAKDDRAASVRDAATELLSATRGSQAYDAKLAKAITLIEAGRTMLGRRTVKLNAAELAKLVDLPANAPTGTRNIALGEALHRALRNLAFADIAKALQLKPTELADALATEDALSPLLAAAALSENTPAITAKVLPHLAKLGLMELIGRFGKQLLALSAAERASILDVLTPHILQWRWAHELHWLGQMAGGTVSDALARKLLSGGVWKSSEAPSVDTATYAMFASIMPAGRDADFAAAIADLPRKDTAAAYEFIAFTTALEGSPA